ncbi:MAG: CDC27 family protein [Candidatus Uhrbacteria bacterium]
MSRRDDEHNVLMRLGQDVDLMRQVAEDNRIDGYTRENPGREVRVAIEEASSDLQERLERLQETAEGAENALESIAQSHAESAESLGEISSHTSHLPGIEAGVENIADGVHYLSYLGEGMIGEQAKTNATLKIMAGHTEELPEIRSRLGTLNKIAGTHLGFAAVGVIAQVRQLKVLEEIDNDIVEGFGNVVEGLEDVEQAIYELNDDMNEGFENVVEGLEDVEEAIEENTRAVQVSGKRIERQIAVSAAASAQRIAEHLDYQTVVVSDRLAYLAQVSNANRRAVVAAIEQFNTDEERRKQEVVTAIRSSQENDAESKFRDALMHLSLGRYGAAINALSEVFKYQDTHAPAWMFFGDCCWRLGQSNEARNAYYLASQYALLAKQAGRDTLAMKNKEVFEKSLARLSRLEAILGNDKYARKVLVDGKKAWGKPFSLHRIRYELIRLKVKANPKSGKKKARALVSIAKIIPEVREEISTSSIFKFARIARPSLKYGNGPFVELAEVLDFFSTKSTLNRHKSAANPVNSYRHYVYGKLYKKLRKDLNSMTGNCKNRESSGCDFEKWQYLHHIQKKLIELKKEFAATHLNHMRQNKDAGTEYKERKQLADNHASWSMLTKLHLMVWEDEFAAEYLGWKRPPQNKLFGGERQQPYGSHVRTQLKKVHETLNQLGFFKRNYQISRLGIQLSDLSVIDGRFESVDGVGTVFVPCSYYFSDLPSAKLPQAIAISPWWKPELGVYQSVVVFTPLSPGEAEIGIGGRALCAPLDNEQPHHGSFEKDKVIKIKFELGKLNYVIDSIEKERSVWVGSYHGQKVYYLSDKSPYGHPDDIGKPIFVRVGFFSFNELRATEVVHAKVGFFNFTS